MAGQPGQVPGVKELDAVRRGDDAHVPSLELGVPDERGKLAGRGGAARDDIEDGRVSAGTVVSFRSDRPRPARIGHGGRRPRRPRNSTLCRGHADTLARLTTSLSPGRRDAAAKASVRGARCQATGHPAGARVIAVASRTAPDQAKVATRGRIPRPIDGSWLLSLCRQYDISARSSGDGKKTRLLPD